MIKKKKFYKKKNKKEEQEKLPSNYRIITDKIVNDHIIFFLGILFIILSLSFVTFDFYNNFKKQEVISGERSEVIAELNFWNREVIEKPDFRDGYFKLSLIYYQLGDFKNSYENLEKAMNIDPNFKQGKKLLQILGEN